MHKSIFFSNSCLDWDFYLSLTSASPLTFVRLCISWIIHDLRTANREIRRVTIALYQASLLCMYVDYFDDLKKLEVGSSYQVVFLSEFEGSSSSRHTVQNTHTRRNILYIITVVFYTFFWHVPLLIKHAARQNYRNTLRLRHSCIWLLTSR